MCGAASRVGRGSAAAGAATFGSGVTVRGMLQVSGAGDVSGPLVLHSNATVEETLRVRGPVLAPSADLLPPPPPARRFNTASNDPPSSQRPHS